MRREFNRAIGGLCAWGLLLLGSVGTSAIGAERYVWREGELPSRTNVQGKVGGWGNKQFLSGEAWWHLSLSAEEIKKLPPDGALIEYDFSIEQPGAFEVWNRIGFEFARTPFAWRIDQGEWQTIAPEALTCDLMELDFWCEVAWLQMGKAQLAAGNHTLAIRPLPSFREQKKRGPDGKELVERVPEKVNYASDCLCLSPVSFKPHGKWQPRENPQTMESMVAAQQIFELDEAHAIPRTRGLGERVAIDLGGDWQLARYDEQEIVDRDGPTRQLPAAGQCRWDSIKVPSNKFDRPDLRFCHRLLYRTRVHVPAEMAGRSFSLSFPSLSMIASLHVNGRFCGWTKAMFTRWDCDVTAAIRPGEVNEISLVIKDAYYAFSSKKMGKSCRMSFNAPLSWIREKNWFWQNFDFPVGSHYAGMAGILEAPQMIAAGSVYSTDVFAIPSVKQKSLGLEITLLNPAAGEQKIQLVNEIVPAGGGAAEKVFPAQEVTVPAGKELVVKLAEPWADPKLWWPDQPQMYHAVTKVLAAGKVIDVRRTPFGFRQWQWDGEQFKLNGVPWQLWADTTQSDGRPGPDSAVAYWRKSGQNMWRYWGMEFAGLSKQKALDFMDSQGMIVRRSGIFDGQGANYLHGLIDNKELFDNWIVQLTAQVKEERNHPSILVWSIENEVTFINSRNLGISKQVEPHIARAAQAAMAADPTRPAMVDGGNCLIDNSLPVNGVHYMESFWRDYPDEAYTLAKAYVAHEQAVLPTWGKNAWQLVPGRPVFMGESYFLRGGKPGDFAQFGGEGCFGGWGAPTRRGAGLYAKMLAEGYRWHGVAAHHFWLGAEDTGELHHNSWKPVCLLAREWNWTFAGGSQVERTLKLFNNTRHADPIEAAWELSVAGQKKAGATQQIALAPGAAQEIRISFPVPKVAERTAGQFTLTCRRGGTEVFREVKPVAVIDPDGGPKPSVGPRDLVVLDPCGTAKARLRARGIAFQEVASAQDIPAGSKLVLVGKDALTPREATDPRWLALAGGGTRLVVLEQAHPLCYTAVPADLTPTDFVGRIAFSENLAHPVFAGLDQPDFFTWSKDHIVYRNAYVKATQGAVSLAHCDEQLGCSAISECPVNDGLMLLCQMVVGEKLGFDPVAGRLFDNLLAYAAGYAPVRHQTAVVMDDDSPMARLLADSGLQYDKFADVLEALRSGKHQIIILDAARGARGSRANQPESTSGSSPLQPLLTAPKDLRAFTDRGGWLMVWGVTPETLPAFNRLVGVNHVLRPFELERVTLPVVRDPLLGGLTGRDVAMESSEQIFPWAGDKYMVDDEFTYVVDLDDIASFCEFPGAKAGETKAARDAGPGWARNMVNGFTSADAWKLIHYMKTDSPKITLTLMRNEEILEFGIVLNTHYAAPTRVDLFFDDDPQPVSLKTVRGNDRQDFPLSPRKARKLTIALAQMDKPDQATTGIDNVWIRVHRSEEWRARVKPLLSLGGLVKYSMGRGGVVLNQLRIKPAEPVPVNAQKKKAIVSALLRNLHASYSGTKILTTANLQYRPLPLHEQCNQYLTKDRGWFDGRDLAHVPVGRSVLGGVSYAIRDFRTSPAPACVMLAGPGTKGSLPAEVKGLKIGGKADALFFLHAFHRAQEWRPPHEGDKTPPAVFRYVVHYADGSTAEIPVRYGEGVDHWISKAPTGLKSASVAWAAPWPQDASGEQAVVYQMQWNNPRPQVEITGIDLSYDPTISSRYGVPALLGLTAGVQTGN